MSEDVDLSFVAGEVVMEEERVDIVVGGQDGRKGDGERWCGWISNKNSIIWNEIPIVLQYKRCALAVEGGG